MLFCFTFFHIFSTNKLIFKFIGFGLSGEHKLMVSLGWLGLYMGLVQGLFEVGLTVDLGFVWGLNTYMYIV